MNDDAVLLRRYVEEGSENAFSELVGRYVNLVYAGALRRTQGDPHHAAEVAQQVFTTLARHARRLVDHPALGAWLHTATRNAAINLMKSEQRRRQRETVAAEDPTRAAESDPEWDQLRPVLDDAIDQLPEHDRAAIVLRFLEQRDYRQVGAVLRVSEDAARMRAERALEKLRRILSRRGVTSTAAALGLLLQQQVITAAPAGLAASVSTAALAGAATGSGGLLTAFLMNKLTTSALVATATAGLTGLTWNAVAHIPSSHEIAALRAEHAQLLAATAPGADPAAGPGPGRAARTAC